MNRQTGQVPEETIKNGETMEERKLSKDNERRMIRWRFLALLLSGVVIILGSVLLVAFWQMHGQQISHSNATLATTETQTSNSTSGSSQINGAPSTWPAQYKNAAKQEIATELNLSIDQIKEKLSHPQVSLFEVTTGQGFQPNQVFPFWLNVLQDAGNFMIKTGTWTPQQAENYWDYWSNHQKSASEEKSMDAELSAWFTGG
ncbi:MAG TPA: hypothetical protein VGD98_04460 [Ktedonobacteraceae bacterium]